LIGVSSQQNGSDTICAVALINNVRNRRITQLTFFNLSEPVDRLVGKHYHVHAHMSAASLKSERVTLLTTKEFKRFLGDEARREGVSVAELVRVRCERKPSQDELLLGELSARLREAAKEARMALKEGIEEANTVLAELRSKRKQKSQPKAKLQRR
jgi:hypothetical protein